MMDSALHSTIFAGCHGGESRPEMCEFRNLEATSVDGF